MQKITILFIINLALAGCNVAPNSSAVPFLWNDDPTEESYQIMVVSDLNEPALLEDTTDKLDDVGFIIDESEDGILYTEPKQMEGNLMRLSLDVSDNMVIISGFQGQGSGDDIDWEPVIRGAEDYGSPEWELMNLVAKSINNTSVLYN